MAFDIQGALDEGYTPEDINGYLAKERGFDLQGALNEGYSHDEILQQLNGGPLPVSWSEVASGAVENFLPSAGRFVGDLADAVTSPVQTAKALGKTVAGAAQKIAPGDILGTEYVPYADAVIDHYADRYGDIEGFKRALRDDPFGVAADVSAPLTGGAGAMRGLAKAASVSAKTARAADLLTRLGNAAETAAKITDPLTPVVKGVSAIGLPEKLYSSAMKFPTALKNRDEIIATGIREGFVPNAKGFDKLQNTMAKVGGEVNSLIDARTALEEAGQVAKTIDPEASAARAWKNADALYRDTAAPTSAKNAIEGVVDDFLVNHAAQGNLTTRQAQNIKQATQMTLKEAYGQIQDGPSGAAKSANKQIAREMRLGIEANIPDVIPLNKRLAELSRLQAPFERASNRIQNLNFLSLPNVGTTAGAATAAGAASPGLVPATVAGGLAFNLATRPGMKARYAIGLDKIGKGLNTARLPVSSYAYPGVVLERSFEEKDMPDLQGNDLLRMFGY